MTSFTLELMKLTPELASYITKHELQDPKNKAYFIPDGKMGKVFGQNKIRIMGMGAFVSKHLSQLK